MSQLDFLFDHHIVAGVYPVADAFATSATTDYVSLANYRKATFIIFTGDATAGTANGTVTILAASAAAGTGAGAQAFHYRVSASSTSVDTWGALTAATSAGFSMTAGDNYLYACEIRADEVEGIDPGNPWVACKVTEVTNDPIVAGILIILSDPRSMDGVPVTAIA